MNTEEITAEEKCENLMNVVVEYRKRFGKMCVDYDQKALNEQNKILNLQLETIDNCQFKSKNPIKAVTTEDMIKDVDEFAQEIYTKQRRIENVRKKLKNIQEIVEQMKRDEINKKAKEPFSSDVMLARAKSQLKSNQPD